MPTYDYICKQCGDRFEYFQSMSSSPLKSRKGCEDESCKVVRVISGGTGLIFKGSGFYLTDYKKTRKETASNDNKSNSKKDKKGSTKKSEKPRKKTE